MCLGAGNMRRRRDGVPDDKAQPRAPGEGREAPAADDQVGDGEAQALVGGLLQPGPVDQVAHAVDLAQAQHRHQRRALLYRQPHKTCGHGPMSNSNPTVRGTML